MAVTWHILFEASKVADSILVFGSETFVRLSHEHTGVMPGKIGFGGWSAACAPMSPLTMNVRRRVGMRSK